MPSAEGARRGAEKTAPRRQPLRRLRWSWSLTVSRRRPFFLRRAKTFRPALVFMRARNPWSFMRFLFVGLLYVGLPMELPYRVLCMLDPYASRAK